MKNQTLVLIAVVILGILSFTARAVAAPGAEKEWTMMVYLNGNNSLDEFGAVNINQMEKVGSDAHTNIIVQWASMLAKSTKRLYITKDDSGSVASPVIEELAEVDMGRKQSLVDFIAWTAKNYPAKHYFIVVWNHGGGWHFVNPNLMTGDMHSTDISWDEKSGHHISTEELGEAMKEAAKIFGHKVDIYASDACLMAMVEVAYQMYGSVETFLGSEETEPGDGWPYDTFLKAWKEKPNATSLEIGKILTEKYAELYKDQGGISTFSTFEMAKLPGFVHSLKNLGAKLTQFDDKAALKKEAMLSTRFTDTDYADVGDSLTRIRAITKDKPTLAAIDDVKAKLKEVVFANASNARADGISIWWPTSASDWNAFSFRYSKLDFNRKSNWYDFLATGF